jgi:tetratricopeptide (TPR) repeat protein
MARRAWRWLALALGVVGLALYARGALRPRPSLDGAIRLAESGSFDAALARVRDHLDAYPDDGAAHLLMAQVLLRRPDPPGTPIDRPTPGPGRAALGHLDRVRPRNPAMAVLVALNRGKALYRLLRLDEAEAAWLEALRLDPTVAEAGWSLLDLYYLQGREEEARRLALRLHEVEPDPRDRAQMLLELVRQDARPPAPRSLVDWFEPVVRQNPDDVRSAVALGLALVRDGRVEPGVDLLRRAAHRHPGRPEAWDGLLSALDESGQVDAMEEALDRLPRALADAPQLARHRARIAQERRDWESAVRDYRRARVAGPFHRVVEYRLSRALRHAGRSAEADAIEGLVRRHDVAIQEVRPLYDAADALADFGARPYPDLYQRLADARERMQLHDEARAWHRLVLRADPRNAASRAALARLAEASRTR